MSQTTDEGPTTVSAVRNSFELIEAMQRQGGEAGVTEIADETKMSKSSVHKHLATLTDIGFVVKTDGRYRLSLRFLDIGSDLREQYPGGRYIKQKMWDLAQETNEIAFFTIEEDGRPTILYREVGYEGVPTRSRVGMRLYLHQIAAGKAILSRYSESRVKEIVERHELPAATGRTITDYDELLKDLERTRERGYSLSIEEATEGLQAVGVPVKGPSGSVLGGCAVAGPVHRIESRAHDELPDLLHSVANELELNIAHS